MEYKQDFKGQNVYVDKIKSFLVANEENKTILFNFCPSIFIEITNLVENIFENDVTDTENDPKPISTNVKRKSKRKLS